MSDPRVYEQLLNTHFDLTDDPRAIAEKDRLEQRVAELTAELAAQKEALARSRMELAESRQQAAIEGRRVRALETKLQAVERGFQAADAERAAALREIDRRTEAGERSATEIAELRRSIEAAAEQGRRAASEHSARVRELEQLVSVLAGGLAQVQEDINRAADSRAWRWGHGATKALRRLALRRNVTDGALTRSLKRIEQIQEATHALPDLHGDSQVKSHLPTGRTSSPAQIADGRSEEERLAMRVQLALEIRERLGSPPIMESWPPVSIVVPTRDGIEHVKRLVAGLLKATDYPEFELVVVDNASSDGTLEYLSRLDAPFRISMVENKEGVSFSRANAQGAERARHDLLLFLNNDVEPFEDGWLRELVAAHDRDGIAAVGATLLRSEAGNDPARRDRTVQHRSIKFQAAADGVRPYNSGDGEDLFDARFGIDDRAPAVTAACLLIDRATFESAGGFTEGYHYGTEDVDLGLKLTTSSGIGSVIATGRSVLYHRESATQDSEGLDFKRSNRLANRRLFLERWGAKVRRDYRLGRLRGDPAWTDGNGPHIAITVTSLDPADGWGDWYTAHEMGDALTELGWRVTYVQRKGDAWYRLPGDLDYLLALMDTFDLRQAPDHVATIAWVRNWTERWLERPWFDRADVILASSGPTAKLIEEATGRQTIRFPLATNPSRFASQPPNPELAADYVFTGNHWGEDRDVQGGLKPNGGERLDIYGKGWEKVRGMSKYARGVVPYGALPSIYSSAKLVLDDTSGPTLPYGAVNCRVFDALAAGTLVVTNCEAGVRELFDDEFPTWDSPASLRTQLDELLADDRRRSTLAKRYRNEVLRSHTYSHRARQLRDALIEHEEKSSFCIKIGAPNWEEAERWGDLHFARAIQRELRRRGHRCLIQILDEWEDSAGLSYDIALVIRGLSRHYPKPGQFNILWNISHPADVTGEECDGYDLVCVASKQFAETLKERTTTPVMVLEQATDPEVFYPDPSPEYEHDLVYVANSRNVLRPIVRDLLPTDHDLAIYGANWEGLIDARYVVAEHIPNDKLRKVYSSAKIVLCDHWDDMREHGFVSNRIYDALACGATIVSDEVPGLRERFGDAVVTYRDADELRREIDRLLAGDRRPWAEIAVETFGQRVDGLLGAIAEVTYPSAACFELAAPQVS
jgi:GT2 family glycosyltransferase/spore maturation protein CgeB